MYKKLITGLFLALIAVPAFATTPAFETVDADKDGGISHSEATSIGISDEAFAHADTNQDKLLSPEEFQVFVED